MTEESKSPKLSLIQVGALVAAILAGSGGTGVVNSLAGPKDAPTRVEFNYLRKDLDTNTANHDKLESEVGALLRNIQRDLDGLCNASPECRENRRR